MQNQTLRQTKKKEQYIFLLIAFALPFLMGIPLAIANTLGKETSVFATAQMFYPAAGLIAAKLICDKGNDLLPQKFFTGYLILTASMLLWCFINFFVDNGVSEAGQSILIMVGALVVGVLCLSEKEERLRAYRLKWDNGKLSLAILLLFIALYFFKSLLESFLMGEPGKVVDRSAVQCVWFMVLIAVNFIFSFPAFLGEEYGWRCYFQPLLQKKFGLIKGVFVFGMLWGLWHLPLDLFYYPSMDPSIPVKPIYNVFMHQIVCISLGTFMAYAYMKTNNVWLPALIHCFNNNLSAVVVGSGTGSWSEIGICALIYAVLFLPFLCSKVFRQPPDESELCTEKEQQRQF